MLYWSQMIWQQILCTDNLPQVVSLSLSSVSVFHTKQNKPKPAHPQPGSNGLRDGWRRWNIKERIWGGEGGEGEKPRADKLTERQEEQKWRVLIIWNIWTDLLLATTVKHFESSLHSACKLKTGLEGTSSFFDPFSILWVRPPSFHWWPVFLAGLQL